MSHLPGVSFLGWKAVGRPARPSCSVAGPMVQKLRSRSGSNNQLGGPTPTSGNGSKESTGPGAAGSTWLRRMGSRDDSASPTEECVSIHSATSMARSKTSNGMLGKRSSSHGKILEEILAQPAAERKEERVERKPMQLLTRIVESNNFEFATGKGLGWILDMVSGVDTGAPPKSLFFVLIVFASFLVKSVNMNSIGDYHTAMKIIPNLVHVFVLEIPCFGPHSSFDFLDL